MEYYYTNEQNHQILIALLKKFGIQMVVASPGTTNMSLVSSLQQDSYFTIYSSVDERSAGYIACGLAAELQEPVVLTCTGATASRNYYSALTEAFYRKLPVLAVTSSQGVLKAGHHIPQVIDRTSIANDIAVFNTTLSTVKDSDDFKSCELLANKALIKLTQNGGGPVHINLETQYSRNYSIKKLPDVRKIDFYSYTDTLPILRNKKVAIFIGSHQPMTQELVNCIDSFCETHNGLVLCDHTSGYNGKYKILPAIIGGQKKLDLTPYLPDLTIHIGEVSGDYDGVRLCRNEIWRVSEDGILRDTFGGLKMVYEMSPLYFFRYYLNQIPNDCISSDLSYYQLLQNLENEIRSKLPEIELSNLWVASQLSDKIPEGSVLHLAILNSLRAWNYFQLPKGIYAYSNVGGFGIDGALSSSLGASLAHPDKLYYIVIGDLALFYDLNVLGNRHLGKNLRILLINNGVGCEFKNYSHRAAEFGAEADDFMAARGHFGAKSPYLIKHFSENLGLSYLTASTKEEFQNSIEQFTNPEIGNQSIIFEVFTDDFDESEALRKYNSIMISPQKNNTIDRLKHQAKRVLGNNLYHKIRKIANKSNS